MIIDFSLPEHAALLEHIGITGNVTTPDGKEERADSQLINALFFDTEVSDLYPDKGEVLEISMILVSIDRSGIKKPAIIFSYHGYQTPYKPLPPHILEIFSDDYSNNLINASFNHETIKSLIVECDLLVTHNVHFERPFIEKLWGDAVSGKTWICTLQDIEWKEKKNRGRSLRVIAEVLNLPVPDNRNSTVCAIVTMGIAIKNLQQFLEVASNRMLPN